MCATMEQMAEGKTFTLSHPPPLTLSGSVYVYVWSRLKLTAKKWPLCEGGFVTGSDEIKGKT